MSLLLLRCCYNAVVRKEEVQCQGNIRCQVVRLLTPCEVTQHNCLWPRTANWNMIIHTQDKTGSSQHVTSENGVSHGQMGTER